MPRPIHSATWSDSNAARLSCIGVQLLGRLVSILLKYRLPDFGPSAQNDESTSKRRGARRQNLDISSIQFVLSVLEVFKAPRSATVPGARLCSLSSANMRFLCLPGAYGSADVCSPEPHELFKWKADLSPEISGAAG